MNKIIRQILLVTISISPTYLHENIDSNLPIQGCFRPPPTLFPHTERSKTLGGAMLMDYENVLLSLRANRVYLVDRKIRVEETLPGKSLVDCVMHFYWCTISMGGYRLRRVASRVVRKQVLMVNSIRLRRP
ncbi:hypothetical protein CDAR_254521 [Caerostris darwini]|uniref:Uncharacterized protein n=1 Tax=Caerostris darwini TaxID=1538125 RepID=A0AAV4UBC8_9ARAC|nr:hypothetical protein CDAR_254521 [Caerostris darwini]